MNIFKITSPIKKTPIPTEGILIIQLKDAYIWGAGANTLSGVNLEYFDEAPKVVIYTYVDSYRKSFTQQLYVVCEMLENKLTVKFEHD